MDYYEKPSKFGADKLKGTGMGFGPKGSKIMIVRGLDKSPSPLKYVMPPTKSSIKKSFGIAREMCKSHNKADKSADKVVPGPGTYMQEILLTEKRSNAKCGSIGFITNATKNYGREERGSILWNPQKAFPAPNSY